MERLQKTASERLIDVPKGTLRLSQSHGCIQYYHCKKESSYNGAYIHKKDYDLAQQLAQKTYDEKVVSYTEKAIANIERLLKIYKDEKITEIFESEHTERQKLIIPVESTYEQKITEWLNIPYYGKGFAEEAPVIHTNSGIRVRSKSEKILADYFETIGLAYKYECPIKLKGYGTVYPDFTFLSRDGKEIYWEHEGMMDNPDYAKTAIQKIELYEKNGIFPGENLIITFETGTTSINTELIKVMVEKFLV